MRREPKATPNGKRISQLLNEKGWSQETLAGKIEGSRTTVGKLLRGKKVLQRTLHRVADIFNVQYSTLLAAQDSPDAASAAIPPPAKPKLQAHVTIEPTAKDFLQKLRERAQLNDNVSVIATNKNGALIILELSDNDIWALINAACNGNLLQDGIKSVIVPGCNTAEFFSNFAPTD